MDHVNQLWDSVQQEPTAILATSAEGNVTMRTISPVLYQNAILIFSHPETLKYRQLKENPNCCLSIGGYYLEAKPEFLGPTMDESNADRRKVYAAKFQGAFQEGVAFGGRDAEFILLKPTCLRGWNFENNLPTGPFEHLF